MTNITTDWKGLLATAPAVGMALLPQQACFSCWPAYTALLNSIGVDDINYTSWLLPVTFFFLALSVLVLFFQARKKQFYTSFFLAMLAALLIGLGKFVLAMNIMVYGGVGLLIIAALWSAKPKRIDGADTCQTRGVDAAGSAVSNDVDGNNSGRLNEAIIGRADENSDSGLNFPAHSKVEKPLLKSVITCPECGFEKEEIMLTDSCRYFYECSKCHRLFKPLPGDCCVFRSYGSVPCPPVQMGASGCES